MPNSRDFIGLDHGEMIGWSPPVPANLLLATGHAHFTAMTDHEGSGNVDFVLSLHNPDPTRTVTITRARFLPASAGGWLTQNPNPMDDPAFAAFRTPIGPLATATASVRAWWFTFNAHLFFVFGAETSDGHHQDLLLQLPVTITPSTGTAPFPVGTRPPLPSGAPRLLPLEAPILLTLHEPVEAFSIRSGSKRWIPLTGQVVNCTDEDRIVTRLHYRIEGTTSSGRVVTLEGDLRREAFDSALDEPGRRLFTFNQSVEAPADDTSWNRATLELHHRPRSFRLMAPPVASPVVRHAELQPPIPTDFSAPVGRTGEGIWINWNGPRAEGLNGHLYSQSNRYALDILLRDSTGRTQRRGSPDDQNASFYAFDQPLRAIADGTIVSINDTFPDNNGRTAVPGTGNNGLVVQHGPNLYAVYAHTRQGSIAALGLQPGDRVTRGQAIARLGNAGGSSEPHLHLSAWIFEPTTGVHRTLPLRFNDIEDADGNDLDGVIVDDTAFQVKSRPKRAAGMSRAKRPFQKRRPR